MWSSRADACLAQPLLGTYVELLHSDLQRCCQRFYMSCNIDSVNVGISVLEKANSILSGPGKLSRYSDWVRAGRSGDRIPLGGEIFHTCPDRPWGPPSLLYNGYRVFPWGKERPGLGLEPSPPSSAVIMKG